MNKSVQVYVPFAKINDEERLVSGICTSEAKDSHGEIVSKKAIRKAWTDYMEYANVREMHQPSAVGVTKEYQHSDDGTYITVKVVDDRAWNFVKEGVYKGFSIGGRVLKKSGNIIEELILAEISLVDRPANPDAKFDAVKVDGALVDALELEANNRKNSMNKYVEIDGVKYKEDPANAGQPLKDEATGENVVWTEADEAAAAAAAADAGAGAEGAGGADAGAADAGADGAAEVPPAPEEKKVEAAAAIDAKKDTMGTITLAAALDHLDYIRAVFEMNEKDTEGVKKIMDVIKEMIAKEASETDKAAQNGDLVKIFGSELSKAVAPLMAEMGAIKKSISDNATEVAEIKKEIDVIKSTKVSPRPQGSARAVEKVIENGAPVGNKDAVAKRKELTTLSQEISEFALVMKSTLEADPSQRELMMSKSETLYNKYRNCQRELDEMLAAGAQA